MRNLLHWLGTAITAQPFYSDEIRAAQLMLETWRGRWPDLTRFRPH